MGIVVTLIGVFITFITSFSPSGSQIVEEAVSPDKSMKIQLVRKADDIEFNEPLYHYLLTSIDNPEKSKSIGICEVWADNGLTKQVLLGWTDDQHIKIKFLSEDLKREKFETVNVLTSHVSCEEPSHDD